VDFAAIDRLAAQVPPMHAMFDLMRADHDVAQGDGYWRQLMHNTYDRISRPHGRTVADLATVAAPTLLLVGDRDPFCSVEDGAPPACTGRCPAANWPSSPPPITRSARPRYLSRSTSCDATPPDDLAAIYGRLRDQYARARRARRRRPRLPPRPPRARGQRRGRGRPVRRRRGRRDQDDRRTPRR